MEGETFVLTLASFDFCVIVDNGFKLEESAEESADESAKIEDIVNPIFWIDAEQVIKLSCWCFIKQRETYIRTEPARFFFMGFAQVPTKDFNARMSKANFKEYAYDAKHLYAPTNYDEYRKNFDYISRRRHKLPMRVLRAFLYIMQLTYDASLQRWLDNHKIDEDVLKQRLSLNPTPIGKTKKTTVFQARDVQRAVRIKRNMQLEDLWNLKQETEILEQLRGSSLVVTLFETHVTNASTAWSVMELADAGSLADHIPMFGMTSDRALACMQQIFSGLAFVHSQNIIHYDVKPLNVLVFGDGQLKLTDFEISKRVEREGNGVRVRDSLTNDKIKRYVKQGSPYHMAPEVENRDSIDTSSDNIFKVDIFSAGRTFLHLLANGQYDYDDVIKNIRKHDARIYPPQPISPLRFAIEAEKHAKGKSCNRCKSLFKYTLQSDPSERKSAAWIVERMTKWTWRRGRFGIDDAKSKSIVAEMVRSPEILDVWIKRHSMNRDLFFERFPKGTKLGGGSTSFVYTTTHKGNARAVRVSHAANGKMMQRFKTETDILQKLQGSSYVVNLYETHVLNKQDVCHVIDLADGDLIGYIPMSATQALACTQQIFRGLAYIHSRGIVHCDLKCENVLVFGDGRVKLTDFDLSLRVEGGKVLNEFGVELKTYHKRGTTYTLAPEVLRGEAIGDIFKIDIFSAGITFLQLLTPYAQYNTKEELLSSRKKLDQVVEAFRFEKEALGEVCDHCRRLFRYTLKNASQRKTAAWIVNDMSTWRPQGFDDAKSKSIVAQMVRSRRGGGESKVENRVQLRL